MNGRDTSRSPMLVLYSYWRSSSAWRVRIALELKHLSYELRPVNLRQEEQGSASYRVLNQLQQVPVLELELDGQPLRLTQSMAIIDLLELIAPAPRLYPTQKRQRAYAVEAAELINSGVQPLQNLSVQQDVTRLGGDGVSFSKPYISRGLAALECMAKERSGTFCVGDEVSIADVLLVPQLYAARRLGVELEPFPCLTAIEARCAELPGFERAHPNTQPDALTEPVQ